MAFSSPPLYSHSKRRREDPRDAVVLRPDSSSSSLSNLPAGAVVGTSSVRRAAQASLRTDATQLPQKIATVCFLSKFGHKGFHSYAFYS